MKILLTTDWWTPAVNGVVRSVTLLRRELMARGHDVKVLTLSSTSHSYEEDGVIYLGSLSADRVYPGARGAVCGLEPLDESADRLAAGHHPLPV